MILARHRKIETAEEETRYDGYDGIRDKAEMWINKDGGGRDAG